MARQAYLLRQTCPARRLPGSPFSPRLELEQPNLSRSNSRDRIRRAALQPVPPAFDTRSPIARGVWLLGLVGEGDPGFFVQDERADEAVGLSGAGDVEAYRQDPGHTLLEIEYILGSGVLGRLLLFF